MKRGIRNNNPANIVRGASWKGLCTDADRQRLNMKYDVRFCQFKSIYYGVRALVVLMHTYVFLHKLHSISSIIRRFAPPNENQTDVYIANVESAFEKEGLTPLIVRHDFSPQSGDLNLYTLCRAICWQESCFELTYALFSKVLKELNYKC